MWWNTRRTWSTIFNAIIQLGLIVKWSVYFKGMVCVHSCQLDKARYVTADGGLGEDHIKLLHTCLWVNLVGVREAVSNVLCDVEA